MAVQAGSSKDFMRYPMAKVPCMCDGQCTGRRALACASPFRYTIDLVLSPVGESVDGTL